MVEGEQSAQLLWDGEQLLGAGYEFERGLSAEINGKPVEWTERVQVVRSLELARQQAKGLEERLSKAEEVMRGLTPVPGRGKRQYWEEGELQAAIGQVQERYQVSGLQRVSVEREEESVTRYVGRGRGSPDRPARTEVRVRHVITQVQRDEGAIAKERHRLGWRAQVTNAPRERMSMAGAVIHYRGGWRLEQDFHLLKDRPLGISPLYVSNDDQILGLTRLLSLALRLLTLIQTRVRYGLAEAWS